MDDNILISLDFLPVRHQLIAPITFLHNVNSVKFENSNFARMNMMKENGTELGAGVWRGEQMRVGAT